MGITGFQQYIKATYPDAIQSRWLDRYDNVYVDMNYLLHRICAVSSDMADALTRTQDYLDTLTKKLRPTKRLVLVSDGFAPMAKLALQQSRRTTGSTREPKKTAWDWNLHLTLGTEFMTTLGARLGGFVEYIGTQYHIQVICMFDCAGEGETKITSTISRLQRSDPLETHVVLSSDSDMILMLFGSQIVETVYHIVATNTIIHYGTMYRIHVKRFGETKTPKDDFVFLNLLMGNDYLPKTKWLRIDRLWDAYAMLSREYPYGLVRLDRSHESTVSFVLDPLFFHDLIYTATRHGRMGRFDLFDPHDQSNGYDNYIKGLYWSYAMYMGGECVDYAYRYTGQAPHPIGVMISGIAMSNHTMACARFDLDPMAGAIIGGILLVPWDRIDILPVGSRDIVARLARKFPAIKDRMCVRSYQMICEMIRYVVRYMTGHSMASQSMARSTGCIESIQAVGMDRYVPKAQRTGMKKLF